MDDLGLKDNNNVLKLLAEEIGKKGELFNYMSKQVKLCFNSETFENSDDRASYLSNLYWPHVNLEDIIEINKYIDFSYIFLDTADRHLCYVKHNAIEEFGFDYSISGNELEFKEYSLFKEHLKKISEELYNFYGDYVDDKIAKDLNGNYEKISKVVEDYFNKIEGNFDIAIWADVE